MESLAEYLVPEDVQRESFSITDHGGAMWAMRKMSQAKAEIKRQEAIAEAEIDRLYNEINKVKAWLERVTEEDISTVEFMEGHITAYYKGLVSKDPDFRTLDLPTGKVRRRQLPQDYERNDAELITWAEKHAKDVLKVTTAVDWAGLKKRIEPVGNTVVDKSTGEIIPGVVPKGREERVWVECE